MEMLMTQFDLAGVAGVPETALSDALIQRLPGNLAEAPWSVTGESLIWMGRASDAASQALPSSVRGTARGIGVVGGMVRYTDTPVGTYDEVFGAVGFRHSGKVTGTVSFMAVDSEESLVGGRTNWAMPKTLATFSGGVGNGRTMTATGGDAVRWTVSARARVIGPPIPYKSKAIVHQQFPDGSLRPSQLVMRSRMRPAIITVKVSSDGPLADWLRPGRHLGAVISSMEFSLGVPAS
jgi:hypothetical protein